jgi:hypothetical protein
MAAAKSSRHGRSATNDFCVKVDPQRTRSGGRLISGSWEKQKIQHVQEEPKIDKMKIRTCKASDDEATLQLRKPKKKKKKKRSRVSSTF